MSIPSSDTLVAESALIVSLGQAACACLSRYVAFPDVPTHQFFVDLEGSMAIPEDSTFAVLECSADAHDSVLRTAAQATLAQLPPAMLQSANIVLLVCDLSTRAGRHASLVWAQAMQVLKAPAFIVAMTPKYLHGADCLNAARTVYQQLQALCPSCLEIDGSRLSTLTDTTPFVHHACRTLSQATGLYNHVNIDVSDLASVLSGRNTCMGYSVMQPTEDFAWDVMDDVLRGPLLTAHELHRAVAVVVIVEAARGTLKLSHSRAIMQQITRRVSQDAHVVYAASYNDNLVEHVGVTVIASY